MGNKRDCPLCGNELEDNPADHDVAKCENTELLKGRDKIRKLTESLNSWKDAWFQLREIIGNLWWYHPAIDNDDRRLYYQTNQQRVKDLQRKPNDVYVGDKLIGSGTSPDAANAIRRLMLEGNNGSQD